MKKLILLALLAFLSLEAAPARAAENRLMLADQSDYGGKRGFYLDFENSAPGGDRPKLPTLRLILGVADGKIWRFLVHTPAAPAAWQYDHDYHAQAVITPTDASLWLDGVRVESQPGAFLPLARGPLAAFQRPAWASDPAEYLLLERSLTLTPQSGKPLVVPLLDLTALPPRLALFESDVPTSVLFAADAAKTLTVDATFRIVRRPDDLRALGPFIDRYGQAVAADFPGKVKTDADLAARADEETRRTAAWGREKTPRRDAYGGSLDAGWSLPLTGFYATAKHGGIWWLVTPLGHPVFYTGLCSAPALRWDVTPTTGRESLFASLPPHDGPLGTAWVKNAWGTTDGTDSVALNTLNMIKKYGPGWEEHEKSLTRKRLSAWGFTGLGKWTDPLPDTPDIPVLSLGDVPKLARHFDPFDSAAQAAARAALERQIAPRHDDPRVVGWSVGNEYDEIITGGEIKDILALADAVPARAALLAEAKQNLPGSDPARFSDADREHLRRFYAARYYDFLYRTVKSIDPHHLYLGFWITPGWWENDEDWRLIAAHCDVVGYDLYNDQAAPDFFARLLRETDKPALCGEFCFPPLYHGTRGFGLFGNVHAEDDADAGRRYQSYVSEAARNPFCVGTCWFQLRDEPLTGRGPGHGPDLIYGEDYALGLVDVTDTPKWDLVTRVRAENLAAAAQRLAIGHARR